jgi:hypothetical protein
MHSASIEKPECHLDPFIHPLIPGVKVAVAWALETTRTLWEMDRKHGYMQATKIQGF